MGETKTQDTGAPQRTARVVAAGAVWLVSLALAIWGLSGLVGGFDGYTDPPPPGGLADRMMTNGALASAAAVAGAFVGWRLYRRESDNA